MTIVEEIRRELGGEWLPVLYADKVRTLRTRAYSLDIPERENQVEIMHTLLGVELKVGRSRFACPDLATARYIRIFARCGCRDFAVPYDITRISSIADELETAWQRMLLLVTAREPRGDEKRLRSQVIKAVRLDIQEIGPGEKMPEFTQSTKQRGS
ncbi:MAG TPA: hypothetical protein VFZ23_11725 [Pyrinomonadaceae bacterium]